jgi:hypothetical protein
MDLKLIIVFWKSKFNLDFRAVTRDECFDMNLSDHFKPVDIVISPAISV